MAAHRRQRQHRRVTTPVVVLEAGVRTPNFALTVPAHLQKRCSAQR
jgi:hypothetical protein